MNVCLEMDALFPCVMSKPFCCCRKRLEQQQKMLEEDRKRRQFEEQKQKLRLLSSVKPKVRPASHRESARQNKDREMVCSHQVQNHSSIGTGLLNVSVFVLLIVCIQTGEKSRDDALEAIKGNLDGFSRDAKMHPSQASQTKKQGMFLDILLF